MSRFKWLDDVAEGISGGDAKGAAAETLTVREFLGKFCYSRRGSEIVSAISNALDERNLRTMPDFNAVWIDSDISIVPIESKQDPEEPLDDSSAKQEDGDSRNAPDPTARIGSIKAAKPPVSVNPNATLKCATTIMLLNDYSQLPVIQGEYRVKGVISWESIGVRTSLNRKREFVHECMDTEPQMIDANAPLLEAVRIIEHNGYVLVKENNKVTGIVTASDIAQKFEQLSTPFLLVGEIEGQLRHLIEEFPVEVLKKASRNPEDAKSIEGPADLSFGDYVQLLGKPENWDRLGLSGIDRKEFVGRLDEVRKIRNDVMHFSVDDLPPDDIRKLESFAGFFRNLADIKAT